MGSTLPWSGRRRQPVPSVRKIPKPIRKIGIEYRVNVTRRTVWARIESRRAAEYTPIGIEMTHVRNEATIVSMIVFGMNQTKHGATGCPLVGEVSMSTCIMAPSQYEDWMQTRSFLVHVS